MGCQKWLYLCAPIFLTYFWRSRWCGLWHNIGPLKFCNQFNLSEIENRFTRWNHRYKSTLRSFKLQNWEYITVYMSATLKNQIRLTYTSKYTEVKTMNNLCVTVSIKLCKNGHREISMYTRPSVYIRGCQIDDTGPQLLNRPKFWKFNEFYKKYWHYI